MRLRRPDCDLGPSSPSSPPRPASSSCPSSSSPLAGVLRSCLSRSPSSATSLFAGAGGLAVSWREGGKMGGWVGGGGGKEEGGGQSCRRERRLRAMKKKINFRFDAFRSRPFALSSSLAYFSLFARSDDAPILLSRCFLAGGGAAAFFFANCIFFFFGFLLPPPPQSESPMESPPLLPTASW